MPKRSTFSMPSRYDAISLTCRLDEGVSLQMTKGRAQPNSQPGCIFCGGRPLSKEHIWGQWVLEHVPRTTNKYNFGKIVVGKNPKDTTEDSRVRTGDPLNANVRVVCANCNSGWMSQIQERAKPHLIPLFKGQSVWLDMSAQAAIATWAIMATITSEHIQRAPSETTVPPPCVSLVVASK
jgi:hypothetical protein